MINLERRDELIQYLEGKQIVSKADGYRVDYCKGGISCVTALIEIPGKTLLIKQGRARLAVKEEWLADPKRMGIEAKANDFYHRTIPESSPAVLFYDAQNCILLRNAAPAGCNMWKTDLLEGILDFNIAAKAITALAAVHNRSASREDIKKEFSDYSVFHQMRVSPYLQFLTTKHPALTQTVEGLIRKMEENRQVIVHSDYSPKNILVLPDRSICILDYETAHYGDPAFDLAFFANHIVLKAVHLSHLCGAFLTMLLYITSIYFKTINFTEPTRLEARCMDLLAILMLARIDGKSPAEYITSEKTKKLVREMAFALLEKKIGSFQDAVNLFLGMSSEYQFLTLYDESAKINNS